MIFFSVFGLLDGCFLLSIIYRALRGHIEPFLLRTSREKLIGKSCFIGAPKIVRFKKRYNFEHEYHFLRLIKLYDIYHFFTIESTYPLDTWLCQTTVQPLCLWQIIDEFILTSSHLYWRSFSGCNSFKSRCLDSFIY